MPTGTVKPFDGNKGHGYINQDDDGPDVYVHFSAIQTNGYSSLEENQRVAYEVVSGPKGPQAEIVRPP